MFESSVFSLTFVLLSLFCCLFVFSKLEQEEIEKHIAIYLSDFVPEWGKQWHSHLCYGAGVEPPQSVPVSGKAKIQKRHTKAASDSLMGVNHGYHLILFLVLFCFSLCAVHFAVRVFLQHVQRLLERVQHDRNQLGDPRPEHRHWRWEGLCRRRQQSTVFVCSCVFLTEL